MTYADVIIHEETLKGIRKKILVYVIRLFSPDC